MPADRSLDSPSPAPAAASAQPAAEWDTPILEETELFVPDPAWTLSEPDAIREELQRLVDNQVTCLLRPEDGNDLLAQAVAVDATAGCIEWHLTGPAQAAASLQVASRVTVSATLGRIDLLFEGRRFTASATDPPVVRCTLPERLQRVQRRDAYRVRMRAYSRGGPCVLMRWGSGRDLQRARILDLSVGGCGLLMPAGVQAEAVPIGTLWRALRVELGPDITFMTAAEVVWHATVRDKDTLSSRVRVGCAWRQLSSASERLIQQHLDEVQRQRRRLMKA
jgi:c-di-GMP-binding flagellar brake protein YcgR